MQPVLKSWHDNDMNEINKRKYSIMFETQKRKEVASRLP